MIDIEESLRSGDALLIVDVQKDFCSGGALPIEEGEKAIPILNRWIAAAVSKGVPIYASRDWHPVGHISFQERGGSWPPHCIQDSDGASFHGDLKLPNSAVKVTKGTRFDSDLKLSLRRDRSCRGITPARYSASVGRWSSRGCMCPRNCT